jgi:hypothetical protein
MSKFRDCFRGISIRRRMEGIGGRAQIIRRDFFVMILISAILDIKSDSILNGIGDKNTQRDLNCA